MAYMKSDNSLKGIGRILVKFYQKGSDIEIAETLSESDGYIYYMGLEPGEYVARVDSEQLANLQMVSSPEVIPVNISASFDGDIVGGLDFTLSPVKQPEPDTAKTDTQFELVTNISATPDTAGIPTPIIKNKSLNVAVEKPSDINSKDDVIQAGAFNSKSDSSNTGAKWMKETEKPVHTINIYSSVIQVGAFARQENATRAEKKLIKTVGHPVTVIFEDGLYKVRISGFSGRIQALRFVPILFDLGFSETYVVRVKQHERIIVAKED